MIRRVLLLTLAGVLIWRMAALGVSAHYAQALDEGDAGAADKALVWNPAQPQALLAKARGRVEDGGDAAAAQAVLARAYAENPADVRPLMAAAGLAQRQGDLARADDLVKASVRLTPSDPRVLEQAARFWAGRGDLDQAMRHWSLALAADPKARERVFPILVALAEDTRTIAAFRPIASQPPSWWEPFFAEVAKRALDNDPVRILFTLRRESAQAPITEEERKTYVARLMKDGMIGEAYIEWVNAQSQAQRAQLGLLHNGGFELPPTNWGFDWHVRSTARALVDRAKTYGVDGDKALHLLFDRQERRFADVYQALFLDPGPYRLTGRVRTDSLESKGGIKWTLRCLLPQVAELAESERFLGSNEWRDFTVEFQVPDTCTLQEIRLVSASERPFEQKITGGAWFDRMSIRNAPSAAPAPTPAPIADPAAGPAPASAPASAPAATTEEAGPAAVPAHTPPKPAGKARG